MQELSQTRPGIPLEIFVKPQLTPSLPASEWVQTHAGHCDGHESALDLACGEGRHTRLLAARGYLVTAVDRDISALNANDEGCVGRVAAVEADLEGSDWPFPRAQFSLIVVTNYLHRPLFPILCAVLAPGGRLIYETFAIGNEAYGRPSNPAYLLRPNELITHLAPCLQIDAFAHGTVDVPRRAVTQRIVASRVARDL